MTIADTEHCYPDFQEGQVLTHNDLNQLRNFLYTKTSFYGRALIGFGVACGLDGSIASNNLALTAGFALGQGGRELVVDTAPPPFNNVGTIALDTTVYPFIDTTPGGRTAILRATETIQAAGGACTPAGCTTHTEIHCQGAEIVFVAGRLDLGSILSRSVFTLSPLVPSGASPPAGFTALKTALYNELNGLVSDDTRNLLNALTLDGPPGIDLMKVGVLNEVLYTLWDYWQCMQAQALPCGGYTGPPAVALGWLSQSGTTWSWDCRYRHHFQLALPLYRGIRGYRCQDLCARYLDHIRVLIQDFTPPAIPPEGTTGTEPGSDLHICDLSEIRYGRCGDWSGRYWTDERPWRYDPSGGRGPFPPEPDGGDPIPWMIDDTWEIVKNVQELDPILAGVVTSRAVLGTRGSRAEEVLKEAISAVGIEPAVTVLPIEDFGSDALKDVKPVLMAAASDSIYLFTNATGTVVSMGVLPTSKSLGQVSAVRETAIAARNVAERIASEFVTMESTVTGLTGDVGEMHETVRGLENVGHDVAEARTLAMSHERELVLLRRDATHLGDRIDGVSRRFDALAVRAGGGGPSPERVVAVNAAIYETLETMGNAIRTASTRRAAPRVREALAEVAPQLKVLKRESVGGVSLTEAEPEALSAVFEGMTMAIEATGLDTESEEFRALARSVDALKGAMGVG
jgi:hypothetical protein